MIESQRRVPAAKAANFDGLMAGLKSGPISEASLVAGLLIWIGRAGETRLHSSAKSNRAYTAILLLSLCGASPAVAASTGDAAVRTVAAEQFRGDVQPMQTLAAACAAQASACDTLAVLTDEQVGDPEHGGFLMRWDWLRLALKQAKDAKPDDRRTLMSQAQEHLRQVVQESGSVAAPEDFAKARTEADNVLRTPEFDRTDGPTWWDRKKAQMWSWLARLFDGVGRLGEMAPWMGKLLEWLLFLGAAVGLTIFLLRTLARQRMRLALDKAAPVATAWQREATDWAQLAERHAAASAWREAVHCLYWAAIVLLESRRAWRHNPTRTPREYVRLLKPGSAQQVGLRGLTQVFERVWYGQREAGPDAWQSARASFDQLERGAETPAPTASADTAGATA